MEPMAQRGERTSPSASRSVAPSALVAGSVGTGAAALAVDILSGEHPTHTLALVLVVAGISGLGRWVAAPHRGMLTVLNAAVLAQPALHLASTCGGQSAGHASDEAGVLHYLLTDGVTWGQIAITLVVVAAVLSCGTVADLLAGVIRVVIQWTTRGVGSAPCVTRRPTVVRRRGSMLRWCGWMLRAARRGPPPPAPLPAA